MQKWIIYLTVFLVAGMLILTTVAYLYYTKRITNSGKLKTVEVEFYFDVNCTQIATHIDWGILVPNETKPQLLYCKNIETAPVTLTLEIQNWNPPETMLYITTTWNYANQTIQPNEILPITFTLQVSPTITNITLFTFDYLITAQG